MIEAKVIKDSISSAGKRITTFQLKYQRFIHSEVMTHRMFSRNASSSRAIPVKKMIEQVLTDPAMPIHWGQNIPGMQAHEEIKNIAAAKALWIEASKQAASIATVMNDMGIHKQIVNRGIEPWQWIHVVVTATEWDNFFMLRDHPAAQPEIQELAKQMKAAMDSSVPEPLMIGEWHLPYVSSDEIKLMKSMGKFNDLIKMSAARCARVSYMRHDGEKPLLEDDLELFNMLVTRPFTDKRGNALTDNDPRHYSPVEHQACPYVSATQPSGNFLGWQQYRKIHESTSYK